MKEEKAPARLPARLPVRAGAQSGAAPNAGMWATALAIARQEGMAAFMKGWLANYARMGPQTTITFLLAEALREAAGMQRL